MRFTIDSDRSDPDSRMRRVLLPWLSQEQDDLTAIHAELVRMLEGVGLPPFGHDEEPYAWIVRGLPLSGERNAAVTELSRRVASLLETEPEKRRLGARPDQVLYNLLLLAASLMHPETLEAPLAAMRKRGALKGDWLGGDLRTALLVAMIKNQSDARLRSFWEKMLAGEEDAFFFTDPYLGFEGILLMPEAAGRAGEPALTAIGAALSRMTEYLTAAHFQERKPRFQDLLTLVEDTYPSRSWPARWIRLADEHRWPAWAVDCVPSLVVPIPPLGGPQQRLFIGNQIAEDRIPELLDGMETALCDGHVLEVTVPAAKASELVRDAKRLDRDRLNNPFPSDKAARAVMYDSLRAPRSIDFRAAGVPPVSR